MAMTGHSLPPCSELTCPSSNDQAWRGGQVWVRGTHMGRRTLRRYKKQGGALVIFSPGRQGKESNFSLPSSLRLYLATLLVKPNLLASLLAVTTAHQPSVPLWPLPEEPLSLATAIFNSRRDVHQPFPPEGLSSSTARQAERYSTLPPLAPRRSGRDESFLAGTHLTRRVCSYQKRQEPLECPAP